MDRLGYVRYGAQGGDWGSGVTTALGALDAAHCAGIHITLAMGTRPNVEGEPTAEEARALKGIKHYADWDSGYSKQQSTRPQTLGYGADGFAERARRRGSSKSSGPGPIATAIPKTSSPATNCSTTSCSIG